MEHIVIRKITSNEVESAMCLALEVFMQLEAPDYHPSGVETFKRDIVENPEYLEKARQGGLPFYLAIGFVPLSEEQEINGIRFTPMKYIVNR